MREVYMDMPQGVQEDGKKREKKSGGIDGFRIAAALFVLAIHTSPLKSYGDILDYLVTYCLGRIGVPFFLMTTGYFLKDSFLIHGEDNIRRLIKYLIKIAGMYLFVSLLYLPLAIYSGQWEGGAGNILKKIFFDGTFYHLWYFPALILGCILLCLLSFFLRLRQVTIIVLILYLIGIAGDSYYGLISSIEPVKGCYEALFAVSSYTRNGVFFAPVFIWLGVCISNYSFKLPKKMVAGGAAVSLILMLLEGLLSYIAGWQRHNSMYLFLIPVMYFLYLFLLGQKGISNRKLRAVAMWIYLLHPFCIIIVRGFAKVVHLETVLIGQSLVHFVATAVCSICLAFICVNFPAAVKALIKKEKKE